MNAPALHRPRVAAWHPILFSRPMVQAILAGTKTQTRRVIKLPYWAKLDSLSGDTVLCSASYDAPGSTTLRCPLGGPGDRLWVRETWRRDAGRVVYAADLTEEEVDARSWKPSIFMPREASRTALEVVSVRVETVQDISEVDAVAEGIDCCPCARARARFMALWEDVNGARKGCTWRDNPPVWVVEFRRLP